MNQMTEEKPCQTQVTFMSDKHTKAARRALLGIFLAAAFANNLKGSGVLAQTESGEYVGGQNKLADAPPALAKTTIQSESWHAKEGMYYKRNWGVDVVGVRVVSSGWMLRFDYRVLDEKKAKPLFDKAAKPYLVDDASGARLSVPTMENIGDLRQSPVSATNRVYFMIFGNPGKLVKPGSNVSVVIGDFHVDGLTVN